MGRKSGAWGAETRVDNEQSGRGKEEGWWDKRRGKKICIVQYPLLLTLLTAFAGLLCGRWSLPFVMSTWLGLLISSFFSSFLSFLSFLSFFGFSFFFKSLPLKTRSFFRATTNPLKPWHSLIRLCTLGRAGRQFGKQIHDLCTVHHTGVDRPNHACMGGWIDGLGGFASAESWGHQSYLRLLPVCPSSSFFPELKKKLLGFI